MELKVGLLSKIHNRTKFCCGKELLDNYIKHQASQDVKKRISACFVLYDDDYIVKGYYTLSNSSIPQSIIPDKYRKRLPKSYKNIPVTLLGRLAIDTTIFGMGQGGRLLIKALKESLQVSKKSIGSMAVIVDPIDDEAFSFYKSYGFSMIPGTGKMFFPMDAIEKLF